MHIHPRPQEYILQAIVFDFFGTLTDPGHDDEREAACAATARVLGVDEAQFCRVVAASFAERAAGVLGGTAETLRELAFRCGGNPDPRTLAAAVAAFYEGARCTQSPRDGVLETLPELRDRGYVLGLLSDCGSELCELWSESVYAPYFDATVFSWEEGYRKPDPRSYLSVASWLGVDPSQCWYVGDGNRRALQGAKDARMRPVVVTHSAEPHAASAGGAPEYVISDITELPEYVSARDGVARSR